MQFLSKIEHFERTCRAKKNSRGNSSVGVIQEQANQFESEETGDEESQHENSVGWVNPVAEKRVRSWDSHSSGEDDYTVMAVRSKTHTELRVAEAKLPIMINGQKTSVWLDSVSPVSIFTVYELRKTLGAAGMKIVRSHAEGSRIQRLRK